LQTFPAKNKTNEKIAPFPRGRPRAPPAGGRAAEKHKKPRGGGWGAKKLLILRDLRKVKTYS
jgi:hypothetical protein